MVSAANTLVPGRLVADLKIARGLDYTGTVYETTMAGYESMGSISSGGRYDSSWPPTAAPPTRVSA